MFTNSGSNLYDRVLPFQDFGPAGMKHLASIATPMVILAIFTRTLSRFDKLLELIRVSNSEKVSS